MKVIFNMRMAVFLIGIWIIFFFTDTSLSNDIVQNLLNSMGGVEIYLKKYGPDFYQIVRWSFITAIPIFTSLLYFNREIEVLCMYTMIRSSSIYKWWLRIVALIAILNYLYCLIGITVTMIGSNSHITFDAVNVSARIFLLFPTYTFFLSLLCIFILLYTHSRQLSVLTFLLVGDVTMIIGIQHSGVGCYMIGCFGMVLRSDYSNSPYVFSTYWTVAIMAALIVILVIISGKVLRKINPAARAIRGGI